MMLRQTRKNNVCRSFLCTGELALFSAILETLQIILCRGSSVRSRLPNLHILCHHRDRGLRNIFQSGRTGN